MVALVLVLVSWPALFDCPWYNIVSLTHAKTVSRLSLPTAHMADDVGVDAKDGRVTGFRRRISLVKSCGPFCSLSFLADVMIIHRCNLSNCHRSVYTDGSSAIDVREKKHAMLPQRQRRHNFLFLFQY